VFRKFSAIICTPGGQWSEYVCLCHQNSLSRKRILREGARYVNECETSRKGEGERGATRKHTGMVQPVSTGERGVITDISFQRSVRDIKVAWGNHYSDIVRSSLFRESLSLSLFLYIYFSISLSSSNRQSLFISLSLSLSAWFRSIFFSHAPIPAVFSNVSLPFKREGKDGERGGSLSEFLVRVAVTLSQIHFAVGEFPLVHVPGIGTRVAFQSREFLRRFLPLLPRAFFPPSDAARLCPAAPRPEVIPTDSKMEPRRRFAKRFLMDCT